MAWIKKCRSVLPLALVFFAACSTLPPVDNKVAGYAAGPSGEGTLAGASDAINASLGEDESAFLLLPAADEAMKWRLALIDSAVESIDAQYFIWKGDASGSLMLEHVLAAADRGVKVRILVDDMFLSTEGAFKNADDALAAIDFHPNIQLRLFNPGKYRDGIAGLAGNFGGNLKQYNRRMHNKLIIFDGHFAILGGRNIGDEYFGLMKGHNFLDLDVLAAGAVSTQASLAYDSYWNAGLTYPAGELRQISDSAYQEMRAANQGYVEEQADMLASYTASDHQWPERINALVTSMAPGYAAFLQDEPVHRAGEEYRLYSMLDDIAQGSGKELITSTPYLIPVGPFLQSEDLRAYADVAPQRANFIGLHMKASSVDGKRCFIGSLNMDPRSVQVNTENGLYIESPGLCGELHAFMKLVLQPESVWAVSRDGDGKIQYTSDKGTTDKQPAQGTGQRVADFFFRLLPVESQL